MATDRRLREALLAKLGVSHQRLSQLVAQTKLRHGPMSTEDAAYLLAHQRGLDSSRYLPPIVVERVRGMVPRDHERRPAAIPAATANAKLRPTRSNTIHVGAAAPGVDLLLSKSVADDAARMAELYPKIYLLENSIRQAITVVLTAQYGKDWWSICAPAEVQKRVQDRKAKEAKIPWHGKRGTDDIFYSDFSDLRSIIVRNWLDFASILPSQPWISQRLEELEPARNILAHHNPVPTNEQKRLDVYFDDWVALIADKRALLT
jgi:hypothetical protein